MTSGIARRRSNRRTKASQTKHFRFFVEHFRADFDGLVRLKEGGKCFLSLSLEDELDGDGTFLLDGPVEGRRRRRMETKVETGRRDVAAAGRGVNGIANRRVTHSAARAQIEWIDKRNLAFRRTMTDGLTRFLHRQNAFQEEKTNLPSPLSSSLHLID